MKLYQYHLPSEVRIFEFTGDPTLASSEAMFFDIVTTDAVPVYCRSYLFTKRWMQIFMTMDAKLSLKPDDGDFPFVFNCDITTPHYIDDDHIYTTDLCVDLLVAANGKDYRIKDIDAFEKMHSMNHFGDLWFEQVKNEISFWVDLLESGKFINYLNDIAPFPIVPTENKARPMQRCNIGDVAFEHHPLYPQYE
jgi:hypothetical protein